MILAIDNSFLMPLIMSCRKDTAQADMDPDFGKRARVS